MFNVINSSKINNLKSIQ